MTARIARLELNQETTADLRRAADDSHDLERMNALVAALPHPALILRANGKALEQVAVNAPFETFWRERQADAEFDRVAEKEVWVPRALAVARGKEPSVQFDIAFGGVICPRAYRCTFSRIAGETRADDLLMFSAVDRTDERRIETVLRRELMTDTLTALPNRAGFLEEVEDRSRDSKHGAMIVVDLVRFSRINESLGATAGDELIITVARRIKSILRARDMLARVGGNEFAIHSLAVKGMADAQQIADRVRATLENPIRIASYLINVEAAVGCALQQEGGEEAEEMFRRAQAAVKHSKSTGTFEIYRPSALAEAQERFTLESRLREALQHDRLELDFQPFVSLSSGEVVGFEALARWNDEELGRVSPTRFIPVAEESGLIVPLGRWAMRESAMRLAEWDRQYGEKVPLTINVNLSPVQIARDDVAQAVQTALEDAGVDGKRFTIELTESALIADLPKTKRLLSALKGMDLTIAMDDFGTGFSNLANLQTLPIDILKIDRSFVTGMVSDRDKIAIVRAILSLAGALGMRTVAEGIETAEVGKALAELGCDRGQGYYYARPMPADAAYAFWLERNSSATR
jgi:diguanylate cyclase (GGDEF)-like protein